VLEGIKVGHKHVDVKLLQFADDTLFFCQPKLNSILAIKTILHCFEITSGLKVNFHKIHMGTIRVTDLDKAIFPKCLNYRCVGVPFKYLGMKIGGSPRSLALRKPVIYKIKIKLSTWKGKLISMASRLCLIKAVFTVIPLFYLSFYKAPVGVCKILEEYKLNFFGTGVSKVKMLLGLRGTKFVPLLMVGCQICREI